jgi:8-oxo-dGTP pyrophosphatase MutT (NUDIX family)
MSKNFKLETNQAQESINLNPQLQKSIEDYCALFSLSKSQFAPVLEMIQNGENLQDRKNMNGHLASQGFLFNKDFSKVLLLHHKSLDMWIQPGGHIDPQDKDLVSATKREVLEETGIENCDYLPIDKQNPLTPARIVINGIPANSKKQESDHIHIDLAYVFQTQSEQITIDPTESNNSKWVSFEEFAKNSNFSDIAYKVFAMLINPQTR